MKNLLKFPYIMCFAFILFSCTSESTDNDLPAEPLQVQLNNPCVDEDPITRLVNNGTVAFDLLVIADDGSILVDIPNVPANTTTSWVSFPEGQVLFSIDTHETQANDDKVVLQMNTCMAFDIEIDGNNEIVSYTPTTL